MIIRLRRSINVVNDYNRYSIIRSKIERYQDLLEKGNWIIEKRYAYNTKKNSHHLVKQFNRRNDLNFSKFLFFQRFGLNFLKIKYVKVAKKGSLNLSSILYISRNGTVKLFNVDNKCVLTELKNKSNYIVMNEIYNLPFFSYFKSSSHNLVKFNGDSYVSESLVEAPDFENLEPDLKICAYKQLISNYELYALNEGVEPKNQQDYKTIYYSLSHKLDDINNYVVSCEDFLTLIASTVVVPVHLDFNSANLMYDGNITVLDNEDLGLVFPVFYDLINLAYNNLRYHNRTDWFEILLSDSVFNKFNGFCKKTISKFDEHRILDLFSTYFILSHSDLVCNKLNVNQLSQLNLQKKYSQFISLISNKISISLK